MQYSKIGVSEKPLDAELFKNPGSEYRSVPFWGWNGELRTLSLLKQIEIFKEMGYGGFHMHARMGLVTPYLSDEFMDRIAECCEKAEQEGMFAWLYDEDRYPSGPAGGIVTRNPGFTRRYLRFTPFRYGEEEPGLYTGSFPRTGNGELLARYSVELDGQGYLQSYSPLKDGETDKNEYYAYFEKQPPTTPESQTYVDTLNPKAIQEFARVTYDRYRDKVGRYFGTVSPGMFTDEPQYASETVLRFAKEKEDLILPWTDDFPQTFKEAFGDNILEKLPEIVWNFPDAVSRTRFEYHDHVAERFVSAFCDTLGEWCGKNGIYFTGHVMSEGSLEGQTVRCGEAMRCYRAFQLPGIDVLGTHKLEYTTAKQAQSAVRQQGSAGLLSELYGVSGWDFDFRGFKLQGDWQAAMGVTLRVPHHCWYTMRANAKRDYPGSMSYQAPWWKEYRLIEDHFARINTALTRGKPVVRVGVIHPIESMWLNFGPMDQSGEVMEQLESNFRNTINMLVEGLIDFDLISESRLPELCEKGGNPLQVGRMAYDAVVVPALHTLRETTLVRLEEFRSAGGRLIFLGGCPKYVDAYPSDRVRALYDSGECLSFERAALLNALRGLRFLDVVLPGGNRASHLIYTLREDKTGKWLFIATARWQPSPDVDIPRQGIKFNVSQKYEAEILRFSMEGEYALEVYDTLTGGIRRLPAVYRDGKTLFRRRWYMHDSLLLRLVPGRFEGEEPIEPVPEDSTRIFSKVKVTLDEPNVLLLDMARYALDGEPLHSLEEILRLDNIYRSKYGYPLRRQAVMQPYQTGGSADSHSLTMRFTIQSQLRVESPRLALENPRKTKITLNGKPVDNAAEGFFGDWEIECVALPPIEIGENILDVTIPFSMSEGAECCYLLGDFGVKVSGIEKTLTAPVRELAFGNWTGQGLPFYGGNVTYHMEVEGGPMKLRIPHYRGAMMRVWVDDVDRGVIAFSPYQMDLPDPGPGLHKLDVKLYGTRQNCFAPVHHLGGIPFSQGPDSWRSTGDLWNYEYCLSEKGILSSPRIYR
jgi:hypothetical protein